MITLLVVFVAAYALASLPIALWIKGILVLGALYLLTPLGVYFRQRIPKTTPLEAIRPGEAVLPVGGDRLEALTADFHELGFRELGRFRSALRPGMTTVLAVLQHPETGDMANVMVTVVRGPSGARSGVIAGVARRRGTGGWLRTGASTVDLPAPHDPRDDALQLPGAPVPAEIWRVHQLRAARDASPATTGPVENLLAFQRALEQDYRGTQLRSGYWRSDGDGLRPTLSGAYRMTWRVLPPWKQILASRERRRLRELGGAS